jgi:hypothetical protein
MIKAEQGPCHIGRIVHIRSRKKSGPVVTVKLLGRISTLKSRPEGVTKDEVGWSSYVVDILRVPMWLS